MNATTALPFSLAPHVRACACDGQVILLDLRTNRYVGVGPGVAADLSQCVEGWPCPQVTSATRSESLGARDIQTVTQRFVSQGLLARCVIARPTHNTIPVAEASLDFEDLSSSMDLGARTFARFMRGAAFATCRLRLQSLETIARSVAERRRWQTADPRHSHRVSPASMRANAIAYERLRPLLLTARKKCLFDSLSLLEFLAGDGLFPHWVIGIKTAPFGAHAWVQYNSMVLNDQHARVRQFRPILVA